MSIQISEEEVIQAAEGALSMLAAAVGGTLGAALGVVSGLIGPVFAAIKGGGAPDLVNAAITKAIVDASDADMKKELGP